MKKIIKHKLNVEENKKHNTTLPSDLVLEVIKHLDKDQLGIMRLVCQEVRKQIDARLECGIIEYGFRNQDIREININNTDSNIRISIKIKEVSDSELKNLFLPCNQNSSICLYFTKRNIYILFKQIYSLKILLKRNNIPFKYVWCYILENDGKTVSSSHISIAH